MIFHATEPLSSDMEKVSSFCELEHGSLRVDSDSLEFEHDSFLLSVSLSIFLFTQEPSNNI
jgi:hypothetical protein